MDTEFSRNQPRIRGRLGGLTAAAFVSASVWLAPAPAAAFDLNGIIGTALALQMASQYGAHSYYHAKSRTSSGHSSESTGSSGSGEERDAREFDAGKSVASAAPHRQAMVAPSDTRQASERDARMDGPTFNPSR